MKKGKLLLKIIAVLCLLFGLCFSVSAANHVEKIDVEVILNEDGSAKITQVWEGDFSEGTECYYEFNMGDRLKIRDFKVSLDGEKYTTLKEWDVYASFWDKAYKCGLNYIGRDTYEVCWGISKLGTNRYTVEYTVENVVVSYAESDGFNFRFINSGMNTGPTDATIVIKLYDGTVIDDSNCNIWGFGYSGTVDFYDGNVIGVTQYPMGSNDHMTIMMELEKGILTPSYTADEPFDAVREEAFEGSYYDDYYGNSSNSGIDIGIFVMIVYASVFIIIFFGAGITKIVRKMKLRKIEKTCQYNRDVPKEDINVAYSLLNSLGGCKEEDIISARILRLIGQGVITPIDSENEGRIIGKGKVSFRINPVNDGQLEHCDKKLYEILKASAGSDGILEPVEMKVYCRDHPAVLRAFLRRSQLSGEERLDELRCSKKGKYTSVKHLSTTGTNMLNELYGLKKYLLEFSLIDERTVSDTYIWQEYLVYATLFGIADKVADQLVKVNPQLETQVNVYRRDIYFARTCRGYMYSNMRKTEQAARARAAGGSGGRVSFGGGGGFSGGGARGGTR